MLNFLKSISQFWLNVFASILGGILCAVSFPPFDFFPIFFVFGFLLILYIAKTNLYYFVISITVMYAVLCIWIESFGLLAFALFLCLVILFSFVFIFVLKKLFIITNETVLTVSLSIVLVELLMEKIPTFGFPWLPLGLITHDESFISPIYSFIGVHGMSGLIILFCLFIPKIIDLNFMQISRVFVSIFLVLLLVQICNVQSSINKTITTVQPGKLNDPTGRTLTILSSIPKSDFVVLPESSLYEYKTDDLINSLSTKLTKDGVAVANVFYKINYSKPVSSRFFQNKKKEHYYNTNLVINKNKVVSKDHKTMLVPFGEYVPFEFLIGWMPIFDEISPGFSAPKNSTQNKLNYISTSICYEVAFSNYITNKMSNKNYVHIVTTNNTSYNIGNLANVRQQLAHSQIRAIENGVAVVQSSLGGDSAIIQSDGDITKKIKQGKIGYLNGKIQNKTHFVLLDSTIYSYISNYQILIYLFLFSVLIFRKKKFNNG